MGKGIVATARVPSTECWDLKLRGVLLIQKAMGGRMSGLRGDFVRDRREKPARLG